MSLAFGLTEVSEMAERAWGKEGWPLGEDT